MKNKFFILLGIVVSTMFIAFMVEGCGHARENSKIRDSNTVYEYFIGTYTRKEGHVDGHGPGIYWCTFNSSMTELVEKIDMPSGINPSYIAIHPNGKYLYAVNEIGGREGEPEGLIEAFSFDRESPGLTKINQLPSHGIAPCYISVTKDGNTVLAANYVQGTIVAYPIGKDGSLGVASDIVQFAGKGNHPRQEAPHAHYIKENSSGQIYTTDLGTDSIRIYDLVNGKLELSAYSFKVTAGAGPRHMAFHPSLKTMYVVNELNASIEVIDISGVDIPHRSIQQISTKGENDIIAGCADIHLTPDGRFLYASNRGELNNLALYKIDTESGLLTWIGHQPISGKTPRNFSITNDGRFVIVANQDSDNLVIFSIHSGSGRLDKVAEYDSIYTPVCLLQI